MKILYIAKHGSGENDDEGAIGYVLTKLGHEVVCVQEREAHRTVVEADLLLFHKWDRNDQVLQQIRTKVKAFWYFDLVQWPSDPTLADRNRARVDWMQRTIPLVDVGFCTDGDWVEHHKEMCGLFGKEPRLHWLPQGADERLIGFGKVEHRSIDILITAGVKNCGKGRQEFHDFMHETYGNRLHWIERGVYGEELRNLVARSKIVVAPQEPTTGKYWSNRVYLMLGFGACLLHPWCGGLTAQYMAGEDLELYSSLPNMEDKIESLMNDVDRASKLRVSGFITTANEHLYRHRCEKLIEIVKEKM